MSCRAWARGLALISIFLLAVSASNDVYSDARRSMQVDRQPARTKKQVKVIRRKVGKASAQSSRKSTAQPKERRKTTVKKGHSKKRPAQKQVRRRAPVRRRTQVIRRRSPPPRPAQAPSRSGGKAYSASPEGSVSLSPSGTTALPLRPPSKDGTVEERRIYLDMTKPYGAARYRTYPSKGRPRPKRGLASVRGPQSRASPSPSPSLSPSPSPSVVSPASKKP